MSARRILFICACLCLGICLGIWYQDRAENARGIAKGVYVGQLALSGLHPDQAHVLLSRQAEQMLQRKITLVYQELSWQLDLKQFGASFDLESIVQKAYAIGREGNLWQRFWQRLLVSRKGLILVPELELDEAKLAAYGAELAAQVDRPAKNARLEVDGTQVKVIPAVEGRRLQREKLPSLIRKALLAGERLTLPVEKLTPSLTTEEVEAWGIKEQIAGFATRFNPENTNRVKNVKIAAGKIDNLVVMPGEEFSFNKAVGTRGLKEGYAEAPVIIDGKLVPGLGGGVCQVSSTLYNAILLADLKTTKRSHHSMPVAYLPIGRDAAVAYDYLDLRFRNTSGGALLLKTYVEGDRIRVAIFGSGAGKEVTIESIVEEVIPAGIQKKLDASLQPGQEKVLREGVSGYKVKVWRTVKKAGKILKRELVSSDFYKPVDKIIATGPKLAAAEKEVAAEEIQKKLPNS